MESGDDKFRLLYLFSVEQTKSEMEEYGLQEHVKESVAKYKDWEDRCGAHSKIEGTTAPASGPFAVADSRFMVWIGDRPEGSQVISIASNAAMDEARKSLQGLITKETDKLGMLRLLGLT